MRWLIAASAAALCLAAPAAAGSYGFTVHDVLVRQAALAERVNALPQLSAELLGTSEPRIQVKCWGVQPIAFANGGHGFDAIHCTTSKAGLTDYLYTRDSHGRLRTRDIAPTAP